MTPNKHINPIEPWMSSGILSSKKRKNALAKISLKNPTPVTVADYKTYRNLYSRVIKNAQKLYFERQLEANQKNLRKHGKFFSIPLTKKKKK